MRRFFYLSFIVILSACTNTKILPTPTKLLHIPTSSAIATASPITKTPTPTVTPYPTLVPESAFIKGITLSETHFTLDTNESFQIIEQYIIPAGANYVAIGATCFSEDYADTNIICDDRDAPAVRNPTDQEIIAVIARLHQLGLRVILKPGALIMTELVEHRYTTRGANWSEIEWGKWFDSYAAYISHYAKLAEDNDVDIFVIGSEQQATTHREEDWRRIIAVVRQEYHGPITYAACACDFEASRIKFWDDLDFIGTNGYFAYVNKDTPTVEEMKQAWMPIIQRLEEMSLQYGKPVLITEIGTQSIRGFNSGQMAWWDCGAYDEQTQADYYHAFFEVLMDKPWIKGVVLWSLDTDEQQARFEDTSSNFIGKAAQVLVHQYFDGIPIFPTPTIAYDSWIEDPARSMVIYDDTLRNDWLLDIYPSIPMEQVNANIAYQGEHSIYFPTSRVQEVIFYYGYVFVDMSRFKWVEFYFLIRGTKPSSLRVSFLEWTPKGNVWSRFTNIDNADYLDTDRLILNTWQRIRIPLSNMGITNQRGAELIIQRIYPHECDVVYNDVYIDNVRLVAGKP